MAPYAAKIQKKPYFCPPELSTGEMAERLNVAVSKTVEGHTSGGSNPSLSADLNECPTLKAGAFCIWERSERICKPQPEEKTFKKTNSRLAKVDKWKMRGTIVPGAFI